MSSHVAFILIHWHLDFLNAQFVDCPILIMEIELMASDELGSWCLKG